MFKAIFDFMGTNELLDGILEYLTDRYENGHTWKMSENDSVFYINSASNKHLDDALSKNECYSFLELELALEYLVEKTDYIKYIEFTTAYQITFTGRKFIQDGGYTTASEREINQKRIQNLKDWLLIFGAIGATFGTIYLGYFEYVKLNRHYPFGLKIWKIDLGICILLGTISIIVLVFQRLRKSKKIQQGKT